MHQLAKYFKEREDFDCIVTDKGFASYRISGEECYIRDIWVDRDFRKQNIAAEMADMITGIAHGMGCTYLTGSVSTTATDPTTSIKVLLAYGFSFHSQIPGGLYFRKDL